MTEAEVMLWSRLRLKRLNGAHFRRQHPIGPYVADFACVPVRLVLEVDGATHSSAREVAYDRRRDAYMAKRGWRVVRVNNDDMYRNLDGVCEMIFGLTPPPPVRASALTASPAMAGEEEF